MIRGWNTWCDYLVLVLLALLGFGCAKLAAAPVHPIALAALPSGNVYVLEGDGRMSVLQPRGTPTQLNEICRIPEGYLAADLGAGFVGTEEKFFLSGYRQVFEQFSWILQECTERDRHGRTWSGFSPDIYAGVAVDHRRNIVYLTTARTSEIRQIDLGDPTQKSPRFLLRVRGSLSLGALTIDVGRRQLYAADPLGGKIYAIDLARNQARELVGRVGSPHALSVDETRQRLFIADSAGQRIWQVQTNETLPQRRAFDFPTALKQPLGLAVGPDGTLWVADFGLRAIFALTPSGQLRHTLR
jgi:DNA-binding beta-propeller fold protein YncE